MSTSTPSPKTEPVSTTEADGQTATERAVNAGNHDADRDVLFEQWVRSTENLRARPVFLLLLGGGVAAMSGGVALSVLGSENGDPVAMVGGIALAVGGAAAAVVGVLRRSAARAAFYERQDRAAKAGEDEAIDQLSDDFDLRGLLRLNRTQMANYEALTRRQAASSYRLSHFALAVGLALIAGGGAAALFADGGATKAATAGLAGIAAAVSAFIARTYLRIYERTLLQLNYYFEQPLVSSYILTAERLVSNMGEARRDDALDRIVERLLHRIGGEFGAATGDHARSRVATERTVAVDQKR